MKRGRGTCSTFQSFQLTYHECTTFIDVELYIYESTNVPLSSERTWTPFHQPLFIGSSFFVGLTVLINSITKFWSYDQCYFFSLFVNANFAVLGDYFGRYFLLFGTLISSLRKGNNVEKFCLFHIRRLHLILWLCLSEGSWCSG